MCSKVRGQLAGSAIYIIMYFIACQFHTANGRQGEGGGGSAYAAVVGGLAALLAVAIVVLVITGLCCWRSACVCTYMYIHPC